MYSLEFLLQQSFKLQQSPRIKNRAPRAASRGGELGPHRQERRLTLLEMAGAALEAHQGQWERLTPARLLSPGAARAQACQRLDFGKRRARRRERNPSPGCQQTLRCYAATGCCLARPGCCWGLGQTHQTHQAATGQRRGLAGCRHGPGQGHPKCYKEIMMARALLAIDPGSRPTGRRGFLKSQLSSHSPPPGPQTLVGGGGRWFSCPGRAEALCLSPLSPSAPGAQVLLPGLRRWPAPWWPHGLAFSGLPTHTHSS